MGKMATPLKRNPPLRGGRSVFRQRWQKDPPGFDSLTNPSQADLWPVLVALDYAFPDFFSLAERFSLALLLARLNCRLLGVFAQDTTSLGPDLSSKLELSSSALWLEGTRSPSNWCPTSHPFLFWLGGFGTLLKKTTEKSWYPYSVILTSLLENLGCHFAEPISSVAHVESC